MRSIHPTLRWLNTEWSELADEPLPCGWRTETALGTASSLAEVLSSVRSDPDAVLGALLRSGDATARRVVLQAMLGCVVLAATRDPSHDLDDYIAELWLGIATYPLDHRPARIAANLALDTRKRVRGRMPARSIDPARIATLPDAVPGESSTLLLARARRTAVIDATSESALRLVYADGLDTRRAAAVLGLTPAALRQRCHRALRRLAAHAADLQQVVA